MPDEVKRLDETVPGGRYLVDGRLVNANGEPIEDGPVVAQAPASGEPDPAFRNPPASESDTDESGTRRKGR